MEHYGRIKNDHVGYPNSTEMLLIVSSRLCGCEAWFHMGLQSWDYAFSPEKVDNDCL